MRTPLALPLILVIALRKLKATTALCALVATLLATAARAAPIEVRQVGNVTMVLFQGDIVEGDGQAFASATNGLRGSVIVALAGDGGLVAEAIRIGEIIHQRSWATYVSSEAWCVSACGLIWLAGSPRLLDDGPGVMVGFHACYDANTKQPTPACNAAVGVYIDRIGLSYASAMCVTQASPDSMGWMSQRMSGDCQIAYTVVKDEHQPQPPTELKPEAPVAGCSGVPSGQPAAYYRTFRNSMLRDGPSPNAPSCFGPPPNDYIPAEAVLAYYGGQCSRYESPQTGTNVWCPVTYNGRSGWMNAYLLLDKGGQHLSCALVPDSAYCHPGYAGPPKARALQDLHLRAQASKDAPDVLGPPPNDYIPSGASVDLSTIDEHFGCVRVPTVQPSGYAAWCPVSYAGQHGWVNGYYLVAGDGRRLSCSVYSGLVGCAQIIGR